MSNQNQKTKKCTYCNADLAYKAQICPNCGRVQKTPFYKKAWFIILIVIVAIGILGSIGNDEPKQTSDVNTTSTQEVKQEEIKEYTSYTVSQLIDDLEENALIAENTYLNQYVEITGRLSVIDSDGKYISLAPQNDMFTIQDVQCYIKNDEQKAQVANLSKGDVITVKGKIKSIGELMGYSLDIDSIN